MAEGQGKRIPDEVRAQVIAALLQGQGVSQVAEAYKIPKSSVSRLKNEIPQDELHKVVSKKRAEISDRIAEFLDEGFDAIRNSLRVTQDNAWLTKQSASELATFVGVTSDKIFRILEAIESAGGKESE
jgi:transposase-like protein